MDSRSKTTGSVPLMKPSPLVTLLTDFGTRDGYAAAMTGVVLDSAPEARVMDAGHDLDPQDVAGAAWALHTYGPYFPPGSIHVAVVDPGVGSDRAALLLTADDRIYLAPDNGLLHWVMERADTHALYTIRNDVHRGCGLSSTFHGRDVFAFVAGMLASGCRVSDVADPRPESIPLPGADVTCHGDSWDAPIVHVDRFGNLVTALCRDSLDGAGMQRSEVRIPGQPGLCLHRTYSDVGDGEALALIGSSDHIEVAVRNGSAASRFGLERGDHVSIMLR